MTKVVVGLSGGMDSTTLLGFLLNKEYSVECCTFTYGSKHNKWESQAALAVVDFYRQQHYHVGHHRFDLTEVFSDFKSDLLLTGGDIPEGHFESEVMKQTVVPGRNLIMSSIMLGLAESIKATYIALGVHSGDHHIYPDCRPAFVNALREVAEVQTEGKVTVSAPFQMYNKEQILGLGYSLDPIVPYYETRTCYKDQKVSCGKCGSCQERLEAFASINRKDPLKYE